MKARKGEKQFTSSVWLITDSIPQKVLLIDHKKFNLWLQPGGHIEKNENPIEGAIRETYEETGIDISFLNEEIKKTNEASFLPIPRFILEEAIPSYKDEPSHFHIDLMYVVIISEQKFIQNTKETNGIRFFTKDEALKMLMHKDSKLIIEQIMK